MDVTHEGQQPKAPDTQQLQICGLLQPNNPFTCEALFVWSLVGLAWNHCRWTCPQSRPRLPSVQSGCSNKNTGTHTTNNTTTNTDDDKFGSSSSNNNNDDDDNDMNDTNQNGNSNEQQHTNSSSKMYIAQTNATASTARSVELKTVYHIFVHIMCGKMVRNERACSRHLKRVWTRYDWKGNDFSSSTLRMKMPEVCQHMSLIINFLLCSCCWFDCLDSHGFATLRMDAHGVSLWLSPNWSAQAEHSGAPWSAGGLGRWHRVDRSRLRRVTMLPFKIDKTLANFFRSQTALKTCLDKARGHQPNHIKTCTCCIPTACIRISRRSQYQVSKACIGLQWCSIKSRSKMI